MFIVNIDLDLDKIQISRIKDLRQISRLLEVLNMTTCSDILTA